MFRISPYFRSLALLGSVIRQECRPMLSALAVISILILFAAGAIYPLEREGQPETFGDLPSALWWVVVTLSTVGYGDAVPVTVLGRILGAVIMVLGVGMVALPAGMLASRFSEVMHRQRDLFRRFVEEGIEAGDGVPEELAEQRRLELFISASIGIPTTLTLPDDEVDAVRALAGGLLDGSQPFRGFIDSLH